MPRAVDGIAEAYLALAGTLRAQDSGDFAVLLLRLALDLRPDFTAARLLAADILETQHHPENALQMLAGVSNDDPLVSVVRLQRVDLAEQLGHTDEATHELQRIAHDYPDSPVPAMREGDMLRSKQRFPEAIAAYDRAIGRIKAPGPTDWLVYLRSRHLLRAFAPVDQGGGRLQARADPVPGSAIRAELSRLFLGRHGPEPVAGPRDDREGGEAPAE